MMVFLMMQSLIAIPWNDPPMLYILSALVGILLLLLAYYIYRWRRNKLRIPDDQPPPSVQVLRINYRMRIGKEPLEDTEAWFLKKLLLLQSVLAAKNVGTGKKRRSRKKASPNHRLALVNFCKDKDEVDAIHACFQSLKRRYIKKGRLEQALRMLRLAAIFKPLTPREEKWGIKTAAQLKPATGYWVAKAAVEFTRGNGTPYSLKVLQQSAAQGNEMSKFILTCSNNAGSDYATDGKIKKLVLDLKTKALAKLFAGRFGIGRTDSAGARSE